MSPIWYQLVDPEGRPYMGGDGDVDKMTFSSHANATDFRNAVHNEFVQSLLKGIEKTQLAVYRNRAAFEAHQQLPLNEPIGSLGSYQDMLIVVAPPTQFQVDNVDLPITASMILNPPKLVAFWKAFQNYQSDVKAGTCITLPQDCYLLGCSIFGSQLYIRSCYLTLWNHCKVMVNDKQADKPHLVILGNPGIGKTFFGFVILLFLARDGATIVYESGSMAKRFLLTPTMVVEGSQSDFNYILGEETTYYIVDAVKPTLDSAKTILLTSPRRSIWWDFNKTKCTPLYMPVWSLDEILKCRELKYAHIPKDVVCDCFYRWGGIARYVLEYAQDARQQKGLEEAFAAVDLDLLQRAQLIIMANDTQVSHQLFHYHVSKRFVSEYMVFASKFVQEAVCQVLFDKHRRKLLEFIAICHNLEPLAALRGHLFEGYAHLVLSRGGSFRIRRLVDNSEVNDDAQMVEECEDVSSGGEVDMEANGEVTIAIPSCERVMFKEDDEIGRADNRSYLQPLAKNYESIDAILKPNMLFQMTVGLKHQCKQKGLHDALSCMGQNIIEPRLYFVVPPDIFANFKYQKYLDAKGKVMKKPTFENVGKLQQFALEIQLRTELANVGM